MSIADAPDLPYPGDELARRVGGVPDRAHFFKTGEQSARDIEAILGIAGERLESYPRILDFGCGCGRILLWLEGLSAQCSLHGVDIDADAIEWARENLPFATVAVNQPLPPLDYPDASFDLVFSHSVFTHIDESYQDRWLAELRRVTRPEGALLISLHGEHAFQTAHAGNTALEDSLRRDGFLFVADDSWEGDFPSWYQNSFHMPWYVFDHWSRFLGIKVHAPRASLDYQDYVLLERPAGDEAIDLSRRSSRRGSRPGGAADRAAAILARGPAGPGPGRLGFAGRLVRRVMLRLMRPYTSYQEELNRAIVDALKERRER